MAKSNLHFARTVQIDNHTATKANCTAVYRSVRSSDESSHIMASNSTLQNTYSENNHSNIGWSKDWCCEIFDSFVVYFGLRDMILWVCVVLSSGVFRDYHISG